MENTIVTKNRNSFEIVKSPLNYLYYFYRWVLQPFLKAISPIEANCRFYPSCGQYSKEAFETFSFWKAFALSGRRLSKCHPYYNGENIDLLPSKTEI